jgi:hypothetical protein
MLADYATCGTTVPTGEQIRRLTGDTSGGTRFSQVDTALAHYGITLTPYYGMPWADFVDMVRSGHYAILQGWYDVIRVTRFAGSTTFRQNHAIGVPPGFEAQDPLADGRRGLYLYHKEPYPLTMLKEFAGKLNVSVNPLSEYRPLGFGYVNAAFSTSHPKRPLSPPLPPGPPALPAKVFGVNPMIVQGGVTVTSSHLVKIPIGTRLYRESKVGADVVTKMSATADVDYIGVASPGFRAVRVSTSNFPDKVKRPVVLYAATGDIGAPTKK